MRANRTANRKISLSITSDLNGIVIFTDPIFPLHAMFLILCFLCHCMLEECFYIAVIFD